MSEPLSKVTFLLSTTDAARLDASLAEVAIVGRSNVGKSSFFNALCNRKNLANVSKTPGRTRAINVFAARQDFWIVDLPGYGFAVASKTARQIWKNMIESYLTGRPSLKRVFVLVDAEIGPTKLDTQMVDWLYEKKISYNIIANKIDKVKNSKHQAQRRDVAAVFGLKPEDIYWVSATERLGLSELRDGIAAILEL